MKVRALVGDMTRLLVVGMVLWGAQAQAQTRAAAPGGASEPEILRLKKFSGLANKNAIRTPDYKTGITRGVKPPQLWYELSATYDTAPEWIDELTCRFFAMSVMTERGTTAYTLFKATVRYADIQKGRGHMATAYLHPKASKRYGDPVAVAVEFIHNGTVIAEASDVSSKRIPEDWWKNAAVTESKATTSRDGYLLDRSQSPFALVNIDDYELIK